jgi:mono/diheme cytochrome c family protein
VANYVLGVNTRQLNNSLTYPATGVTDNELRALNHLGLFNPAFDESAITNFEAMSALTNLTASLQQRARSYLDANCAQCHQPGGSGPTFDARFDTLLPNQNLTNYPALFSLGNDNERMISANDVWRSAIYSRLNIVDLGNPVGSIQMPPLARLQIDTNAVAELAAWINSLPGAPTLAPPTITPGPGTYSPEVIVSLQSTNSNATLYYTLNGTLPTTNSFVYSAPFTLTNTATVMANAIWNNFNNSIASSALFILNPPGSFTSQGFALNGTFQLGFTGYIGTNYILQASSNLLNWTSLITNLDTANPFLLSDPAASNFPYRFYRVVQQ